MSIYIIYVYTHTCVYVFFGGHMDSFFLDKNLLVVLLDHNLLKLVNFSKVSI